MYTFVYNNSNENVITDQSCHNKNMFFPHFEIKFEVLP